MKADPRAGATETAPTGVVKWFDPRKRFGFILPDDGGPEVFVPAKALPRHRVTLKPGQEVEFDLFETPRGPQAAHVRPRPWRGLDSRIKAAWDRLFNADQAPERR